MASENKSVVVIGGANVDIHGRSLGPLIDHDSNPGRVRVAAGGVARNVAENLGRLGTDVHFVSTVGNDDYGRLLVQSLQDAGVATDSVAILDACPSSAYLAIIDSTGDMRVAVSDMTIIEKLGVDHLDACRDRFGAAELIVLDTNLSDEALAWLVDMADGQPLFVDTVSTTKALRIKPWLTAVHTLKTSRIEASALSGIAIAGEPDLSGNARWFHAQGVDRLFITLGDQGVFYSTADDQGLLGPSRAGTQVSNTSGAGDAFLAGLALAWLEELALDTSLQLALAVADVTASSAGTNNPALTREMISARLESALG